MTPNPPPPTVEIPSLPEVYRTIAIPSAGTRWRRFLAFLGPGYLVSVGYMDPGNWATDIAGGSKFGYTLLSVILISNLMAILLQSLCVRLGVATGRDLAQACRDYYSKPVAIVLWILCEIAIVACDLAELLGSALALQPAVRHPDGGRRLPDDARRAVAAVAAEQGLPLHRGDRRHAGGDDRASASARRC